MSPMPIWDIIWNISQTDLYDIYARLESAFLAVNDTQDISSDASAISV